MFINTFHINDDVLEYIDSTHTYLVNGVIVESVTQYISKKLGSKYDFIDPQVLERACNYGNKVHEEIEMYERYNVDNKTSKELSNYKFLKKAFDFKCLDNEFPIIIYDKNNKPIMAGRVDMMITKNGELGLADIKTSSVLDKERLSLQLNLYALGVKQSYNKEVTFLSGLHIRNNVRKFVDIKIDKKILGGEI